MSAPICRSGRRRRSVPMPDSSSATLERAALPPQPKRAKADPVSRRRRLRFALLVIVPLVVLIGAGLFWLSGGRYVSTDDAYVKADKVAITAEVSGKVTQVAVDANQHVTRGQLLFTIDDEPYRIALARAEAN